MKQKRKRIRRMGFLALCVMLLLSGGVAAHATDVSDDLSNQVEEGNEDRFSKGSPWLNHADESVYSNSVDAADEEQKIEPKKPGMVEKYLSELIRNIASSLIRLLEDNLGAGLDKIIYGRVGSGKPNSVNIYGFELRSGNPYGVTASACYTMVRSMMFIFLGVSFVFLLAKGAWTGQTAQSRERVKSSFYLTAMKFAMLTLMPYLFDVALYVRDVVLYGVKEVTGQMITGGATLSLSNAFLINAERTGRFMDSAMYLGTVLLTLYFAMIYVAIAIDLLICFVAFPIMGVMHSTKRDLLGGWLMNVLSDILTPILDAVLLLVPLLTSLMLSDVIQGIAIIQMLMCMLIIPSRNRIKLLLGVRNNEAGGLFGVMAAVTLGRALAKKTKGALAHVAGIRSDMQKSGMHKNLADADEEERESLLGGYSREGGNAEGRSEERFTDLQGGGALAEEMESPDKESREGGSFGSCEEFGEKQTSMEGEIQEEPDLGPAFSNGLETEDWGAAESGMQGALKPDSLGMKGDGNRAKGRGDWESDMEEKPSLRQDAPDTAAARGRLGDGMGGQERQAEEYQEEVGHEALTKNAVLRNLDQAMERKQDRIDSLRAQKAACQKTEKQKARKMLDYEKGSDERRELEKQRADAAIRIAETEQKISDHMRGMNQLRSQSKSIRGSQAGVPSSFDEAKADIICKRANINNFEQPEFRNVLSNAQMRRLYKRRATAGIIKGTAALAGAGAGAAVLGGGSIFMQPSTAAMATAAGVLAGSAVGGGAASIGVAGSRATGSLVTKGTKLYGTVRQAKIAEASAQVDFDMAYEQAPTVPAAHAEQEPLEALTPERGRSKAEIAETVREGAAGMEKPSQFPGAGEEALRQTMQMAAERDSTEALKKVLTPSGGLKTSAALWALEKANIETAKHMAALRETQGITLTQRQERMKRVELQTEYMTEEALKKLSLHPDYEKGTKKYNSAQKEIREKVRAIIEKQNKDIF